MPALPRLFKLAFSSHGHDALGNTTKGEAWIWLKVCHSRLISFLTVAAVLLLLCSIMVIEHHSEVHLRWGISNLTKHSASVYCKMKTYRRRPVSESLPKGILHETSDLKPRPLWTNPNVQEIQSPLNLLAMAVGIKQKVTVDKIVQKFPSDNFTVMLFHYDGVVDEWKDLVWAKQAIHVSVFNQTKWWFAKRFLHPDIVASYNYIFIWDEDIGVENFHADKYLKIIEEEGLEISQPALDPDLSELHHPITARRKRGKAHRRMYKFRGSGLCFENSTQPPCTGWVEMMVPVFSRAAWRCAWYMIQNDLVHSWGLDTKLGYCSQGDRSRKVGVVDDEYIVHIGIPSLGGSSDKHTHQSGNGSRAFGKRNHTLASPETESSSRGEIRRQSGLEYDIFRQRWRKAVQQDSCWVDPY